MASKPPVEPYPPDLDDGRPQPEPADGLRDIVDAVVERGDWANIRAPRLAVSRVEFRGTRLTGAQLAEATLSDVVFSDCRLDLVALRLARLERVVFRDCRMEEIDLYGARLKDVRLERCVLREATLSDATLEHCELRACDLTALRGAERLRGARMPWDDALANAQLFATALGIELFDERG